MAPRGARTGQRAAGPKSRWRSSACLPKSLQGPDAARPRPSACTLSLSGAWRYAGRSARRPCRGPTHDLLRWPGRGVDSTVRDDRGQGEIARSWVGRGPNRPITPEKLETALGEDAIRDLMGQNGMDRRELLETLSEHLPPRDRPPYPRRPHSDRPGGRAVGLIISASYLVTPRAVVMGGCRWCYFLPADSSLPSDRYAGGT